MSLEFLTFEIWQDAVKSKIMPKLYDFQIQIDANHTDPSSLIEKVKFRSNGRFMHQCTMPPYFLIDTSLLNLRSHLIEIDVHFWGNIAPKILYYTFTLIPPK